VVAKRVSGSCGFQGHLSVDVIGMVKHLGSLDFSGKDFLIISLHLAANSISSFGNFYSWL